MNWSLRAGWVVADVMVLPMSLVAGTLALGSFAYPHDGVAPVGWKAGGCSRVQEARAGVGAWWQWVAPGVRGAGSVLGVVLVGWVWPVAPGWPVCAGGRLVGRGEG